MESGVRRSEAGRAITHVYNILLNFWCGYRRGDEQDESLRIGTVTIKRQKGVVDLFDDSIRYCFYDVRYQNTTSGENVRLEFACVQQLYRPFLYEGEAWEVNIKNNGNDPYSGLTCDGYRFHSGYLLEINGPEFFKGRATNSVPLTCNWTLFDVIPELAQTLQKSDDGVDIAFLDNLEHLRPKNRLGFLESIQNKPPCPLMIIICTAQAFCHRIGYLMHTGISPLFRVLLRHWCLKRKRMSKHPNIIFLNTDQHSWNALSAYRNPSLHTPNIDWLHYNGTSFSKSYCSHPVCAAARSSWATGLYPSETGVPFNGGHLRADIPDLGQVLNANGYKAFHCGKWHVPGRNVRESFHTRYYGRRDIGAGGAAYYDSASTHAVTTFLKHCYGDQPFYLQIGYVNPHDVCEYLHNHEEKHIPNPVEQGIISEEALPPLPENFNYDERETVLHRVCRRVDDALIHAAILKAVRRWGKLQRRYLIWNYYRFIMGGRPLTEGFLPEKVNAEIGRVLDLLQQTSLWAETLKSKAPSHHENTLIIFSADHGEACGSHQMFHKFTLYEESVRVPFIVACLGNSLWVEKNRFDVTHFVSGVDLFPTVCDYAGIKVPEELQGLSVHPFVEGKDVPGREYAYIESNYWGRAIITDWYKYVTEYKPKVVEDFFPSGPDAEQLGVEQLFDLPHDPWETKNIAGEAGYNEVVKMACREKLLAQEAELHRQRIVHPNPQQVISNWGERLRTYWKHGR